MDAPQEFAGSLRLPGETDRGLAISIVVSDGELALVSASGELGRWARDEVTVTALPDGFNLRAEGDEVLLDVREDAAFGVALGLTNAPPLLRRKMSAIMRGEG